MSESLVTFTRPYEVITYKLQPLTKGFAYLDKSITSRDDFTLKLLSTVGISMPGVSNKTIYLYHKGHCCIAYLTEFSQSIKREKDESTLHLTDAVAMQEHHFEHRTLYGFMTNSTLRTNEKGDLVLVKQSHRHYPKEEITLVSNWGKRVKAFTPKVLMHLEFTYRGKQYQLIPYIQDNTNNTTLNTPHVLRYRFINPYTHVMLDIDALDYNKTRQPYITEETLIKLIHGSVFDPT